MLPARSLHSHPSHGGPLAASHCRSSRRSLSVSIRIQVLPADLSLLDWLPVDLRAMWSPCGCQHTLPARCSPAAAEAFRRPGRRESVGHMQAADRADGLSQVQVHRRLSAAVGCPVQVLGALADCTIGISEWRRSSRGGRAILLWADLTSLRCRRPVTAQPYLAENDQASAPELADSARERRFGMGCWSRPKSQMGFFGRTAEILSVIVHIRFRRCRFRAAGTRETCALPPNYALISPEGPGCPGIGFQL